MALSIADAKIYRRMALSIINKELSFNTIIDV